MQDKNRYGRSTKHSFSTKAGGRTIKSAIGPAGAPFNIMRRILGLPLGLPKGTGKS